jgi:hypothetical protein
MGECDQRSQQPPTANTLNEWQFTAYAAENETVSDVKRFSHWRRRPCYRIIRSRSRRHPYPDACHNRLGLLEQGQRPQNVLMHNSENIAIRSALFEAAVLRRYRRDDNGDLHFSCRYDNHPPRVRRHVPMYLSELLQWQLLRSDLGVAYLLAPLMR